MFYKQNTENLAKAQRDYSRKVKGSNNRERCHVLKTQRLQGVAIDGKELCGSETQRRDTGRIYFDRPQGCRTYP